MTMMMTSAPKNDSEFISKVKRPTEDKALALIAKEALRRGISQVDMLNRIINSHAKSGICHCTYCRRVRTGMIES